MAEETRSKSRGGIPEPVFTRVKHPDGTQTCTLDYGSKYGTTTVHIIFGDKPIDFAGLNIALKRHGRKIDMEATRAAFLGAG